MIHNLSFALKNGKVVTIDEVESGFACNCVCPACQTRLVAKKGKVREHHFAHDKGSICEYGYQTSLHLMAKEIIAEAGKIMVPSIYGKYKGKALKIYDAMPIAIRNAVVEKRIGELIPDVILECSNGQYLVIEIYVTHKVDEQKLLKLRELSIAAIEIDLSTKDRLLSKDDLMEILLEEDLARYWLIDPIPENYVENYISHLDERYHGTDANVAFLYLAEHILKADRHILLPEVYACFSEIYREKISEERMLDIEDVQVESGESPPYILVSACSKGKKHELKIYVNYDGNIEEFEKTVKGSSVSALLIDLNAPDYLIREKELRDRILYDVKGKCWLYNKKAEAFIMWKYTAESEPGFPVTNLYQYAVHRLKRLLVERKQLRFPDWCYNTITGKEKTIQGRSVSILNAYLVYQADPDIPDIIVESESGKLYLFVIQLGSHSLYYVDRKMMYEKGISDVLRIDLFDEDEYITDERFRTILRTSDRMKWVESSVQKTLNKSPSLAQCEKLPVTMLQIKRRTLVNLQCTIGCPKQIRKNGDQWYSLPEDCNMCSYFLGYKDGFVYCLCRYYLDILKDFPDMVSDKDS